MNTTLFVDILTALAPPLIVGLFALNISSKLNLWKQQQLIERRLAFYDAHFGSFNQLYCYACRVGGVGYRLSPEQALELKRTLDKARHTAAPLFTVAWLKATDAFIQAIYHEYTGHGQQAKLLLSPQKYKMHYQGQWHDTWDTAYFDTSTQNLTSPAVDQQEATITQAYHALVHAFRRDLDLAK